MEKTRKYGPLRWELQQRHPNYKVTQHNIIIDVLGGYSQDLSKTLKQLVGNRYRSDAAETQKSVVKILCTLPAPLKFKRTREQCFHRSHFGLYIVVRLLLLFFYFILLYFIRTLLELALVS